MITRRVRTREALRFSVEDQSKVADQKDSKVHALVKHLVPRAKSPFNWHRLELSTFDAPPPEQHRMWHFESFIEQYIGPEARILYVTHHCKGCEGDHGWMIHFRGFPETRWSKENTVRELGSTSKFPKSDRRLGVGDKTYVTQMQTYALAFYRQSYNSDLNAPHILKCTVR